jgi:hypothetical protein
MFLLGLMMLWSFAGSLITYASTLTPSLITVTDELLLSQSVQDAMLDQDLNHQGAKFTHSEENAYVILSLGWCFSTGYDIQVEKAEIVGDRLIVTAKKIAPTKDTLVCWVLNKPMRVLTVPDAHHNIKNFTAVIH